MPEREFKPLTPPEEEAALATITSLLAALYPDDPDRQGQQLAEFRDNLAEANLAFAALAEKRQRQARRRAGREERARFLSGDLTGGRSLAAVQDALDAQHRLLARLVPLIPAALLGDEARAEVVASLETSQEAVGFLEDLIPVADAGERPGGVGSSEGV